MSEEKQQDTNTATQPLNAEAKPRKSNDTCTRFTILVLCCLLMIGAYYCIDIPGAFESGIEKRFNIGPDQYSWFYSAYSIPNIIAPAFLGYLVDKIGIRICIIVFNALFAIGQIVFILGCKTTNYGLAVAGRVIFGLGSENIGVAESTMLAKWFDGKEMALALSVDVCISRLGNAVALISQRKLYDVK